MSKLLKHKKSQERLEQRLRDYEYLIKGNRPQQFRKPGSQKK